MKTRYLIAGILALLMISLVAASFEVGETSHSVTKMYGPGKDLMGWINVSFEGEDTGSTFEDNEGNEVTLIDLLESDSGLDDYSCNTKGCADNYQGSAAATSKNFSVSSGDSRLIGIKFESSTFEAVTNVSFVLKSDSSSSSVFNQLRVDFIDDGEGEIGNDKVSLEAPSIKDYSCFDEGHSMADISLGYVASASSIGKRCQLFNFSSAPGFRLNVHLETGVDEPDVTMAVYDENFGVIPDGSCSFVADAGSKNYYCDVAYLVMDKAEHYVCVYSEANSDSKLKGYEVTGEGCGFSSSEGKQPLNAAFNMSVQSKKFGPVGSINIQNNLSGGDTLSGLFNTYLSDTYHTSGGKIDCSGGCVVPIRIKSYASQNVNLSGLVVNYDTATFDDLADDKFYDISSSDAEVTSDGFIKIDLDDAGFTLSDDFGTIDYEMEFEGKEVFEETLEIERVPEITGLSPRRTYTAYPTPFKVFVNEINNSDIVEYKWDFGDNKDGTSTTNKIVHTYNETGTYDLEVTITDKGGKSSVRIFSVTVGSAEEIINETIDSMLDDLAVVKINLNSFDSFQKAQLEKVLDLDNQEDDLKDVQRAYDLASGGSIAEYNSIMGDLLAISIPRRVFIETDTSSLLFYPQKENMDMGVLEAVGEGTYDSSKEDEYLDAILGWNQDNLLTKIIYKKFDATYESGQETILSYYKVDITDIGSLNIDPHLLIKNMTGLAFSENQRESNEQGWAHIELVSFPKNIVFTTTEDVSFVELPMFIAPDISRLSIIDAPVNESSSNMKWIIFILVIIFLLIIGVVGYIIMQQWYKKKYENYLFKDQNQLYNLLQYVESSKKKGISIEDIKSRLEKKGWNSEQISYATKKHGGEQTGMMEIPIKKILGLFNKKVPVKKEVPLGRPSLSKTGPSSVPKKRFFRK